MLLWDLVKYTIGFDSLPRGARWTEPFGHANKLVSGLGTSDRCFVRGVHGIDRSSESSLLIRDQDELAPYKNSNTRQQGALIVLGRAKIFYPSTQIIISFIFYLSPEKFISEKTAPVIFYFLH